MKIKKRTSEMLDLRKRGYTLQEIGVKYGLTRERVRQIIGTQFKPESDFVKASKLKETFLELRKNHTYGAIGKKFNISALTVRLVIADDEKRLGIVYLKYPVGYLRCYCCHQLKPIDEFSPGVRERMSGRRCRKCASENTAKYTDYHDFIKGGKYYENQRARNAISQAIKYKKMKKGDCILKGEGCFGRIEAHHYLGYAREHWLDVVWTCSQHHTELDKMNQQEVIELSARSIST